MSDRRIFFVDTETTGLDEHNDRLVELSYATETSPIKTLYFGVTEVPEFIDNLIGFTERGISGKRSSDWEIRVFLKETEGHTMVGANPGFDKAFMEANGVYKFYYRMLDIESYAMAVLGLDYVPSMKDIFDELSGRGYDIPQPKHTSASDVAATRRAFIILREIQDVQIAHGKEWI